MLLFRSEEHINRWRKQWNQPRGAAFSLEKGWHLAQGWFGERLALERRKTPEEAQALFASLGFTSEFWQLT